MYQSAINFSSISNEILFLFIVWYENKPSNGNIEREESEREMKWFMIILCVTRMILVKWANICASFKMRNYLNRDGVGCSSHLQSHTYSCSYLCNYPLRKHHEFQANIRCFLCSTRVRFIGPASLMLSWRWIKFQCIFVVQRNILSHRTVATHRDSSEQCDSPRKMLILTSEKNANSDKTIEWLTIHILTFNLQQFSNNKLVFRW